jgi:hypothetical protein
MTTTVSHAMAHLESPGGEKVRAAGRPAADALHVQVAAGARARPHLHGRGGAREKRFGDFRGAYARRINVRHRLV